ncbi:MAG: inorganic diphosphatase [Chitinophagaceae bacterium]
MEKTINVCVETPAGSSAKYSFDTATGSFRLKKILAPGLHFPYDFGFIPGTLGEDGDPLDIIVISEAACHPGCEIECRIIGCLPAEQKEEGKDKVRNDRYVGVPVCSKVYADVNELSDLPHYIPHQLDQFFVNYNAAEGREFYPHKPLKAEKALKQICKALGKMQQPRYMVELFIPLKDNEGKLFPEAWFKKIRDTLCKRFKGVTITLRQPAEGFWEAEDGAHVKDQMLTFELMLDLLDAEYWKALREELEAQFRQEQILIRSTPSYQL